MALIKVDAIGVRLACVTQITKLQDDFAELEETIMLHQPTTKGILWWKRELSETERRYMVYNHDSPGRDWAVMERKTCEIEQEALGKIYLLCHHSRDGFIYVSENEIQQIGIVP